MLAPHNVTGLAEGNGNRLRESLAQCIPAMYHPPVWSSTVEEGLGIRKERSKDVDIVHRRLEATPRFGNVYPGLSQALYGWDLASHDHTEQRL